MKPHQRFHSILSGITLVLLGITLPARAQQYSWSTFAGTPGLTGANDTGGLFNQPYHIARDSNGNVYVADSFSATIRKVTPAGVVSTLAGTAGQFGNVDGTGAAARFAFPTGVAVDGSGNVYVADAAATTIRKITSAGVVTTIAGTAFTIGNVNGTGSAARFNQPGALVVDATGTNLYVSDGFNSTGNHNIRKIVLATAVVTTLAGPTGSTGVTGTTDGTGSAARFNRPAGMAIDGNGDILVCDFANFTIRKVTPAGVVTTFCGLGFSAGSVDGTGSAARFTGPIGIAITSGSNTIYVTESANNTVRKITPEGVVTTHCGLAGVSGAVDGAGSDARLNTPIGIVADVTSNSLLVTEYGNNDIRRVTFSGGDCTTWVGAAGIPGPSDSVPTTLSGPAGVARDSSGNFYVSDWSANVVRKLTPGGVLSTFATGFSRPYGLTIDSAGNLYVADQNNHAIRKITPGGVVSTFAGQVGSSGSADGIGGAAQFNTPYDVKVDAAGNLYVADRGNHTIRKITTPGAVVTTFAGLATQFGSADGLGSTARLKSPSALAVDGASNVYVADSGNNTIRKITPGAVVTTVAGLAGSSGSTDGTGTAARFNLGESGLVSDATGNLVVADQSNNSLRKVSSTGVVTTWCGRAGTNGDTDGVGSAARFNYPLKMALDPQGNVYVPCFNGQTVRKVTPGGEVSTFIGTPNLAGTGNTAGIFNGCAGVVLDTLGNAFVADQNNHIIRMITPAGAVFTYAGQPGVSGTSDGTGGAAHFNKPYALTIDASRNLYVADTGNHSIRKITTAGVVTTLAGQTGTAGRQDGTGPAARFNRPYGISIDAAGTVLYVGDYLNNSIRRVVISSGVVNTVAGSTSGVSGFVNGTGTAALFNGPSGTAVDTANNVYVADRGNNVIRRISASGGAVTTWAGSSVFGYSNGTGTVAKFAQPVGLAVDAQGNVFVAGGFGYDIRKISPTQEVTTVGGLGGTNGYVDGVGSVARFGWAAGIALDAAGNLLIADEDNSCIRKGTRYGTKARLVSPANGSALPAPTTTFVWEPGIGATNYALFIGSTPGGYDLYAGIEGTNLSRTVTLPADVKVYATMYSFIGGAWQGDGYVFDPASSQKAVFTSPSQGSTLGSATLNLQWAGGQGCSLYAIWIGSSYGGYDLGAGSYSLSTNTASFTLPTDGRPVYATLWSYINGAWQRQDRWFTTMQLGAGNRPARLTLPATNNSTLAAGSTNFTWDTGVGATSYALWVGSTPGGYDLYAALEGGGTSRSVGIPADGRTVYVTLFSLIGGSYQSNSYQFTAATSGTPANIGAQLTSPTAGTTLGNASLNCAWSAAPGATNYALWVGYSPGGYEYYAGSEGLSLNKTVTVPTDGSVIHITIWSLIGGVYYPNMTWVNAANFGGTQRARLTSHTNGAALPAANPTLTWSAGTGASGYALWVGSTPGGYDLYAGLEAGTSRAVTVPADGRQIHVTLWTLISGSYQANAYLLYAPKTPAAKATLVTPANGSTLPGSSVNLNWTLGLGVTQYYLFVGSQPGGYDLYIGDQGTSLSRTVTGLPTDARPIHLTLWSLINGAWQNNTYVLRAWQTP